MINRFQLGKPMKTKKNCIPIWNPFKMLSQVSWRALWLLQFEEEDEMEKEKIDL